MRISSKFPFGMKNYLKLLLAPFRTMTDRYCNGS